MSDMIEKQKEKRPKIYSPEEQKLRDEIAKAKDALKAIRDRERLSRQQRRRDQISVTFVLFRHIVALLKSGDQGAKKLVTDASSALKPHEGYTAERVAADREALKRFLENPE